MEPNMPDTPAPQDDSQIRVLRTNDFLSVYANNVVVDATAWDLTLTFGQFDKRPDGAKVNNQRLSVNMPFALAKLMLFWVELQILSHEVQTGQRVALRPSVLPDAPPPVDPGEPDPNVLKLHDAITQLRNRLLASLT
jgi:hypothetical protein